jgi:hypothetical protein
MRSLRGKYLTFLLTLTALTPVFAQDAFFSKVHTSRFSSWTPTWDFVDQYQFQKKPENQSIVKTVKVAKNGAIFVAGNSVFVDPIAGEANGWEVRRSLDSGKTWKNVLSPEIFEHGFPLLTSLFVDDQDHLWVTGLSGAYETATGPYGVILKSEDYGDTWTTVRLRRDTVTCAGYSYLGLTVAKSGSVLAFGACSDAVGRVQFIDKSLNDGINWSNLEINFNAEVFHYAFHNFADGRILEIIDSKLANGSYELQSRISSDDGLSWTTSPILGGNHLFVASDFDGKDAIYIHIGDLFYSDRIMVSNDLGSSWTTINAPTNNNNTCGIKARSYNEFVYGVAFRHFSLLSYDSSGWIASDLTSDSLGLPNLTIPEAQGLAERLACAMAVDSNGKLVFALSQNGIWRVLKEQ